jgi:nucleotide-binding universal stress UspA family protein
MTPVLAFGDDRSAGANKCWEWIVNQRWDGWRLEVVTAESSADLHPVEPEEARLHSWEPEAPRQAADKGFVAVEHLRADIDPRVALIAKTWDLLAIGPNADGRLKALRLGSTADWLLREPASPLVIARQEEPVNDVLLAADGSPHVRRVIDTLASLPWIEGVVVRIVAIDDGRTDTEIAVNEASTTLSAAGAELETVTRRGRPTNVIVEEIERTEPDLVVMGARGRGGFKRLVLGSTTAAVAGSIDRNLLVAHAGEGRPA